jgi:hypothetical protein
MPATKEFLRSVRRVLVTAKVVPSSLILVTLMMEALSTPKRLHSVRLLLFTANIVHSSPILFTLMMEALRSSETLVLTIATRRNIPEDASHIFYLTASVV